MYFYLKLVHENTSFCGNNLLLTNLKENRFRTFTILFYLNFNLRHERAVDMTHWMQKYFFRVPQMFQIKENHFPELTMKFCYPPV